MTRNSLYGNHIYTVMPPNGHGMSTINIETRKLTLVLQTSEEIRALIEGMTPSEKSELSADWLTLVDSTTSADPWIHRFVLI